MFQPEIYNCLVLIPEKKHRIPEISFTVDTKKDLERTLLITKEFDGEIMNLNQIIETSKKEGVFKTVSEDIGNIKFPANLLLSYDAYRTEIKSRIEKSQSIKIEEGEYNSILN